jgi:hypothetical protein
MISVCYPLENSLEWHSEVSIYLLGSNHLLQQTKQKKTEIESKDATRKTHSA